MFNRALGTGSMRGCIVVDGSATCVEDLPIPIPAAGELLLRVQACAVNRLDLLQVRGIASPPPGVTEVLGVECVGTIVSRSSDCRSDFAEGEQVVALVSGGAYAEFVASHESTCFRTTTTPQLAGARSLAELASIPEAFMTAYQLLFFVSRVSPGESVLIHAGASSVGQALIQMCVRIGVAVFATSRTRQKCALCKSLGAADCFLLPPEDARFADKVIDANHGPVHHVLCCIGHSYFYENVHALAVDGTYTLYGTMGNAGCTAASSEANWMPKLMAKRIKLCTTTLRNRSAEYKAELAKALREDDVCGLSSTKPFIVNVSQVFTLEDLEAAHTVMASSANAGKLVLTVTHNADSVEFLRRELDELSRRFK